MKPMVWLVLHTKMRGTPSIMACMVILIVVKPDSL